MTNKETLQKANEDVHEIGADYLMKHSTDKRVVEQNPRAYIKGKFAYFFKKDWDYDWSKYPRKIMYRYKPPDKYRFLGYCRNKYTFKIACKGGECAFVHKKGDV